MKTSTLQAIRRRLAGSACLAFFLLGALAPVSVTKALGAEAPAPYGAPEPATAVYGDAATAYSAEKPIPAAPASPVTETVLPNGLKLIVVEDHACPVVSCLTWYKVGSRNESPGATGLTHLVEHMMFRHAGSFQKGEIGTSVVRCGGRFNGYTSDDFTSFFETLPQGKVELALKIESQRMRSTVFNDAEVQDEIGTIEREYDAESKDAAALLARSVRSALYQQHPYHNPLMGWRNEIDTLTANQAKAYYDTYYWPNNATIILSGDIQMSQALPLVRKYFAGIPTSPNAVPQRSLHERFQAGERKLSIKYGGKQEVLEVAWRAPAIDDADAAALVVLEKILNTQVTGRLKAKLLDAKLCTSAAASYEMKKELGCFMVTAVATPATANAQQKISDAVDSVLNQLKTQPVSDAELRRARNQAEFAFFNEADGPYHAGFHVGYFESLGRWQNSDAFAERLKNVSSADVLRVSKRYLTADSRVAGWVAGLGAPKPPTKPADSAPPSTPRLPQERAGLTGFKKSDTSLSPDCQSKARIQARLLIASAQDGTGANDPPIDSDGAGATGSQKTKTSTTNAAAASADNTQAGDGTVQTEVQDKRREKRTPVESAIKEIPSAIPDAVKVIPKAIGHAPSVVKELPSAVRAVPGVIKNIPAAIGGIPSAIREIPSAIGKLPAAVKEIPGTIGGLPGAAASAIKELPSAIGSIPGAAAGTVKGLPQAVGGIPGAAYSAIKSVPAAIGNATGISSSSTRVTAVVHNESDVHVARRVLKNGMTLLVVPSYLSPIVQITGAVRAGDIYEQSGKHGLASVATAILNSGSAARSKTQLTTMQEDMGLPPSCMTRFDEGLETIDFQSRCLSRDLNAELGIIAESLSTPNLDADADVEKAKADALNTARLRDEDAVSQKVKRALLRSLLAPGSPYCPVDPGNRLKSLGSLSRVDAEKYFNDFLVPAATTIVLAGPVDPDQALQSAEKIFSSWQGKGVHQRLHAHPNQRKVLRAAVPLKDNKRAAFAFGQLIPMSEASPDYGSLLIADAVFINHPLISRIWKRLDVDPALAHALADEDVCSRLQSMANSMAWSINLSVEPAAVPAAVQTFQSELRQFAKTGVSADEFGEAKRYLLGELAVRDLSTMPALAGKVLDTSLRGDPADGVDGILKSIRYATLQSVNRVLKTAFHPEQATLVIAGSGQTIRSARNQVAAHQE
jgi:zinc protease